MMSALKALLDLINLILKKWQMSEDNSMQEKINEYEQSEQESVESSGRPPKN